MKNKNTNTLKHDGVYVSRFKEKASMKVNSVWKIPANFKDCELTTLEIVRIKKANKYLKYMNRKMAELIRDNRNREAVILGDILMRRSSAFQTMILNKSEKKGTYDISLDRVMKILNTSLRGIRKKKEDFNFHRFYILKSNGKWRPIGEPDQNSKFVLTAMERITRMFLEPRIGDYQHGFVTGRSTQTAGYRIIEEWRNGNKIACEFDLKSFFNMINVQLICGRLNSIARGLGDGVKASTFNTHPIIEEYKEEKEIEEIIIKGQKVYRKRGFTQGSPIAPLMSIGALEFGEFAKIPGLIMYADDGVIMSKDGKKLDQYLNQKTKLAGIYIAEDKRNGVTKELEFLGLTLNTEEGIIGITGQPHTKVRIDRDSKELDNVLMYSRYQTVVKRQGVGNIYPGSIQGHRRLSNRLHSPLHLSIYKKAMTIIGKLAPSHLEPSHKIGKILQGGGKELVSGKPQSASTYGSAKVLEFLYESNNKSRKDIRITEYQISESGSSGTDYSEKNGKIFIRYPHNGGVLGHEDERIQNLIPTNFKKLIKEDA